MVDKKDLIIFDIDETVTDPNSLLFSTEYLISKEEKENVLKLESYDLGKSFYIFYRKIKKKKKK